MRITMIRHLLADHRVRRMEVAYSGFNLAEYGVWVAVLVYAYERGGTLLTATLAVAQLVPAGLVAPLLAREVDRHGAATALRWGYWWQALSFGATSALLLSGAPQAATFTATVVAAVAVTSTRPAQAALAPLLVERSEQLTALNVLSGWVESGSMLAGRALAGALIAADGPGAAVGFFALCMTVSALLVGGLARIRAGSPRRPVEAAAEAQAQPRVTLRAGLDALRHDSGLIAALSSFLLLAAAGIARSVLDVSGRTILVRAAPRAVRGRVFGLLEGAAMFGLALGSLLVPVLSTLSTTGVALVATGALLSAVVLTAATRVHEVDALSAPEERAEVPALAHAVIS